MTVALVANIARPISSALSSAFSMDAMGKLDAYGKLGAWSPLSLFAASEVGAWYDPSDLTTMFQDRAGSIPVTADGQTVGKILDKSGRGNHAVAPTDAARPLYKTDGTYHWMQFDGVDDSLSTAAINFTATDKMSVFAGVRKNSDTTAYAAVCGLSSAPGTTNGAFEINAPAGGTTFGSYLRGTQTTGYASSGYAAPVTKIFSSIYDISGALRVNEVDARLDGVRFTTTQEGAVDAGTGNFGNHPLYIGQRGGSTLPFNGNIYSLIVRGASSTTQEITATESWVNGKTGAF